MFDKYSWIVDKAKSFNGTEVSFNDDWGAYVFKIKDKMYAFMGNDNLGREFINVKGTPEDNEEYRSVFKGVIPGYYSNKKHWNSILLESEDAPGRNVILDMLNESYNLVFAKLTKKDREELQLERIKDLK